ncbi:hypothetical protein C8J56DRAFT_450169 [Mycena floridula]|nr:hypothetical protein C8J56DRAFT_450169 [Mycena floridula]
MTTTSRQAQIEELSSLQSRLHAIRQIPQVLLKAPAQHGLPLPAPSAAPEFMLLKEIGENLRSSLVQEALRVAGESEAADKSNLNPNGRRESRKRRRPPSPESPQPYVNTGDGQPASLFPPTNESPLEIDGLEEYIRQFNKSHPARLHIWTSTSGTPKLESPVALRFAMLDVFTAYVALGYSRERPVLILETVAVFGPRERRSPHSQSEYLVFQQLSQQLATMIQSEPRVSVQTFMSLLLSYQGLFIDHCTSCKRVLSSEGHVPPVVRIWTEDGEKEGISWQPRHVACRHN